jgi:hypothetical protein
MAWALETRAGSHDRRRIASAFVVAAALLLFLLRGEQPRVLVDASERVRIYTLSSARTAAIRAERCPRPALREPAMSTDGSPLLAGMIDRASPERRCLDAVTKQRDKLERCYPGNCPKLALAAMTPQPEVAAVCATLYDKIAQLAHTTEACAPVGDPLDAPDIELMSLPFAIKLQVAPLYAEGQLLEAARHITDAIRFMDDYGRKGAVLNSMLAVAVVGMLRDTLDEILTHPRLTADAARAIARDLDILLASAPTFDAVMRQESQYLMWTMDKHGTDVYTGDAQQDRALHMLAIERWVRCVQRACSGKPLRSCVEAHRLTPQPPHGDEKQQLALALAFGMSDRELRRRILAILNDNLQWLATYPASLAQRHYALTTLRMQAELRTMTSEQCHDPHARRATLAPWLSDARITDDPEAYVAPAAWIPRRTSRSRSAKKTPVPRLRCIDPAH